MKTKFDTENWNRKEHYQFFKEFSEPFWGIAFNLDITKVYEKSRKESISYFALSLHRILLAINEITTYKLRIENDELFLYDTIHASATIGRPDKTFGFSFIEFSPDFEDFSRSIRTETDRIIKTPGMAMSQNTERNDTIHFSAIPWIPFTALSHARHFAFADSVPKISTGKIMPEGHKFTQSISLHSHHALADGYDAGLFFESLQKYFNMD